MSDHRKLYNEIVQGRSANDGAPSPCGQKFSDGTPHPESLWVDDNPGSAPNYPPENPTQRVELTYHCLICQSEEKLRGESNSYLMELEKKWIDNCNILIAEHKKELATLREGLQKKIDRWRRDILYTEIADELASLLAPPPTAREANEIEDGFGSVWSKRCPMCGKDSMTVVRPGKAQCENCG